MEKKKTFALITVVLCLLLLIGCGNNSAPIVAGSSMSAPEIATSAISEDDYWGMPEGEQGYTKPETDIAASSDPVSGYDTFDLANIPDYSGQAVITINNDEPMFTEEERTYQGTFIQLSELDSLGRCQVAYACVGQETEPTEERGDISKVYPSGWEQLKLSDGTWLYNRSHLLMFALTGLNDDSRNLITGTEQFNQKEMLAWETTIKSVVDNYNAHVLYRVTPVFDGDNLVAKGVLLEAYCYEYPEECMFNRFVYNVQPGVTIDYRTGQATEE